MTEEQQALIRTPAFKKWFGDWENDPENSSKVVDKNGEPLVVYHTTDKDFYKFDRKKSKEGFFFSPNKERLLAYNKSKTASFFLNIKNPSHELFKTDIDYLISKGYDGIMDYGHGQKVNEYLYEIIAFDPNQIKLADGTNMEFDGNNRDIRYDEGGSVNPEPLFHTDEAVKFIATVQDKYVENDKGRVEELLPARDGVFYYNVKSAGRIIEDVPETDLRAVFHGSDKAVDLKLREKEKKNLFKDSDVRVSNSRKEMMAYRGLIDVDDLQGIEQKDAIMAKALIKKDKVYPKINTQEQIDKGVSGGTLFLKMKLRDVCGATPPNTPEFRLLYTGLAQWLYEISEATTTLEEFTNMRSFFLSNVIIKSILIANPSHVDELKRQREVWDVEGDKVTEYKEKADQIRNEFLAMLREKDPRHGHWIDASDIEKYPQEYKEVKYWESLHSRAYTYRREKNLPMEYRFLHKLYVFKGDEKRNILTDMKLVDDDYSASDALDEYYLESSVPSNIAEILTSAVFGDRFYEFVSRNGSKSIRAMYEQAENYEAFTQEQYDAAYNTYIKWRKESMEKTLVDMAFLTDGDKTIKEKLTYAVDVAGLGGWGYGRGRARVDMKDMISPARPDGRRNPHYNIDRAIDLMHDIVSNSLPQKVTDYAKEIKRLEEKYKVRENNYSFLEVEKKEKKQGEKTDLVINSGVPLSFIKRSGGVAVYTTDVDTSDKILSFYKDVLGITRITYGASLPDKERQAHAKHFSQAIIDLSEALNFNVKDLTGLNNLGILFAAAGHGRAMATYHSDTKAINLTRSKGDGTVCHEMGHYIDNSVQDKFPKDRATQKNHGHYSSFISSDARNVSDKDIMESFYSLMRFITRGFFINKNTLELVDTNSNAYPPHVYAKMAPFIPEFIQSALRTTVSITIKADPTHKLKQKNFDTIEQAIEHYANSSYSHYLSYNYYLQNKGKVTNFWAALVNTYDLASYILEFNNSPKGNSNYGSSNIWTNTAFYLKNKAMKSEYWTFDWELFARGFETYIFDKMAKNNRENNYLVSGAYFDRPEGVYAFGVEREILFILYDELFATIKRVLNIPDFVAFREERVDEYILLGENDTEERDVVETTDAEPVVDGTEEDKLMAEGIAILQKLITMLTTKPKMERGGQLNGLSVVDNLFIFARSGS